MSDRSSAGLFADIFEYLAEGDPDARAFTFAAKLWEMTHDFDFSPYQMGCDEALIKLDLALRTYDEDSESWLSYGPPCDRR